MKLLEIFKRNKGVVDIAEYDNSKLQHTNGRLNKERNIIIGGHGKGRAHHAWDRISRCPRCHSRQVWMENENKSHTCENSYEPVRIRCLICRKKTKYGDFYEVRKIWSNGKDDFRRPGDIIQEMKLNEKYNH